MTGGAVMDDLNHIRNEVSRLGLYHWWRVWMLTLDELALAFNGTGPAWMPARMRLCLDRWAAPFMPAVMAHDVDFTASDGSVSGFRAANRRLLINCVICACDAHPWYSWRRYLLFVRAWIIYRACVRAGWIAWLISYRNNKKKD